MLSFREGAVIHLDAALPGRNTDHRGPPGTANWLTFNQGVEKLSRAVRLQPHRQVGFQFDRDDIRHSIRIFKADGQLAEQAAFIALNERASGNFKYEPPIKVNEFGIPICPKGYPMAYYGFNKEHCRIKWRCPKMAGKRKHRAEVVCEQPCSPSSYGRVVYTKPEWDLRLFTRVPRGTRAWKEVFNTRTASERSNKRKKIDYRLEDCRVRSRMQWYWRAHLIAMNQHLDAWVAKEKPDVLALIFGSEKVAA